MRATAGFALVRIAVVCAMGQWRSVARAEASSPLFLPPLPAVSEPTTANEVPAAPAGAASAGVDQAAPDLVWVHIDGGGDLRLESATDGAHRKWTTLCSAPCDIEASKSFDYRIVGGGRRPSAPFTLMGDAGDRERLEAHGGSKGLFVLGWVLTGAGGTVVGFGIVETFFSFLAGSEWTINGPDATFGEIVKTGLILVAAGAPVAAGGLLLLSGSKNASVSQEVVAAPEGALHVSNDAARGWHAPLVTYRDLSFEIPILEATF